MQATEEQNEVQCTIQAGIGTVNKDGSDSCFPTKRMPMGMLEYMADFYSSPNLQTVRLVLVHHVNRIIFICIHVCTYAKR